MDAPKCKFCGKREWQHVCRAEPVDDPAPETEATPSPRPTVSPVEPPTRPAKGVRADWNGYMRNYRKLEREELKRLRALGGETE